MMKIYCYLLLGFCLSAYASCDSFIKGCIHIQSDSTIPIGTEVNYSLLVRTSDGILMETKAIASLPFDIPFSHTIKEWEFLTWTVGGHFALCEMSADNTPLNQVITITKSIYDIYTCDE